MSTELHVLWLLPGSEVGEVSHGQQQGPKESCALCCLISQGSHRLHGSQQSREKAD